MQRKGYPYSVQIFLAHNANKSLRGTLFYFENFLAPKFSFIGRGHHCFVETFLCLSVPNKFIGKHFDVLEKKHLTV